MLLNIHSRQISYPVFTQTLRSESSPLTQLVFFLSKNNNRHFRSIIWKSTPTHFESKMRLLEKLFFEDLFVTVYTKHFTLYRRHCLLFFFFFLSRKLWNKSILSEGISVGFIRISFFLSLVAIIIKNNLRKVLESERTVNNGISVM